MKLILMPPKILGCNLTPVSQKSQIGNCGKNCGGTDVSG